MRWLTALSALAVFTLLEIGFAPHVPDPALAESAGTSPFAGINLATGRSAVELGAF